MALISVVMPVFNGQLHLEAAVRSVLDQHHDDFELIVVDDGSADGSLEILERLATQDDRVRIDVFDDNQGHHVASNRALELATGEFIVRHDQDDLLVPDWLTNAVGFLESNPGVGVVGGAYRPIIGGEPQPLKTPPSDHTEIRTSLLFKNVFCHPGVTFRGGLRETGELAYREFAGPQDYDLLVRLLDQTRGANLSELAVLYRRHDTTMTVAFESEMPSEVERISNRQLRHLLGSDAPADTGLRSMRRLWRAHAVEAGDLEHVETMRLVFERLKGDPLIEEGELARVERAWSARLISGVARNSPRNVFRLAAKDPAAALRYIGVDAPRAVMRRVTSGGS